MNQRFSNGGIALKLVLLVCCTLNASVAYAEYFGSPTGRTAKLSAQPPLTLEATFSTGDYATADYQQIGVRLNYQYSQKILMFGDLGQSEIGSENETSFGLGAFYSLGQSILGSDDSAVKVSLHQVNFKIIPGGTSSSGGGTTTCTPLFSVDFENPEVEPCFPIFIPGTTTSRPSTGGNIRNIAIELLISGAMSDSLFGDRASWYANGGIQILNAEFEDDTVLGIGAGIVLPLSGSEVYAGFDYADETSIGLGYRYFVQ